MITSYRSSKNYGGNWISAGYALWFLRESRYLNHARNIIHFSCAVSGTGFFFSRKIADEINGWPYHLLTEDIEFSVDQITKGIKIAFCEKAVLYDEGALVAGRDAGGDDLTVVLDKPLPEIVKGLVIELLKLIHENELAVGILRKSDCG